MVVWIIGLSGAGKTTLANEVYLQVKNKISNVFLVDGDIIREIFGNDLGHTKEDRLKNSERVSQLCKYLNDQGIHVICAILSIFKESRDWNKKNISDYYEVFIDTPIAELINRDPKGLYKKYLRGKLKDFPGLDMDFPRPDSANLIIDNTGSNNQLLGYAKKITEKVIGSNS